MSKQKLVRLIPAVASVGAVLPACSDPLVGEWEVTRLYGKVLPISYSDGDVVYTKTAAMNFEQDGDAEFIKTKTVTGAKSGVKSYAYAGVWERVSRGSYTISLDGWSFDCTLDGKEIECDDSDGDRIIEAEKL